MTFFKRLNDHIGELIQLNGALCWRHRGWDNETDRIYLLLGAAHTDRDIFCNAWARMAYSRASGRRYAHLLVNETPQWICLSKEDVKFIE